MTTPGGETIGEANIDVDMDTDPAQQALQQFTRDARGRLRDLRGRFVAEGDQITRSLDRAAGGGDRFSFSLRGLGQVAGTVGPALGRVGVALGGVGAAAGTTLPLLAGVVTALQNMAPAGAVAATGFLAIQQASAAVKLGMVGVEDAVTAAFDTSKEGAKKFEEALEKLSPAAAEFATTLRDLAPAFTTFQQSIQEELFFGFSDALTALSTSVLPVLQDNLKTTARTLNDLALDAAEAAAQLATDGTLGTAMAGANEGLENLSDIPAQVTAALGQLAAAGAPAFDRLTTAAAGAATRISDRLSAAFESGALQESVDTAVGLIGDLGEVAGNVFGTLRNILGAAGTEGEGTFAVLTQITQTLQDVTATAGFQEAIGALVDTMAILGQTVGPLIGAALAAIGPVLIALAGPAQVLITALGEGLQPIIDALGPVLVSVAGAIGLMVTALAPLLPVVGDLIASLLPPLIPVIDTIALAFAAAAPLIRQVGDVLSSVFEPVISSLSENIAPLLDVFSELTATLLPVLSDLLTTLAPTFVTLAETVAGLQGQFAQLTAEILPVLVDLIVQLAPSFVQLATTMAGLLVAVAPLIGLLLDLFSGLLPVITPVLGLITSLVTILADNLAGAITNVVVPAIDLIVALFSGDLSGAASALKDLFAGVVEQIMNTVSNVAGFVRTAVDTIVGIFQYLYDVLVGNSIIPDLVNGIIGLFTGLAAFFVTVLSSIRTTVVNAFNAVLNIARSVFTTVRTVISGAISTARSTVSSGISAIRGFFSDGFTRIRSIVSSAIDSAVATISGLKTRARNALGNIGSTLYRAGRSLIQGFIDGIKSMLGPVTGAVSDIVSSARDFFGFSPAKVGPLSGRGWTLYSGEALAADFARGITRNQSAVRSAVSSLVGTASVPAARTGDLSPFLTTGRSGSSARQAAPNVRVSAQAPNVTVMIDGRVLTDRVRVMIDQASDQAARQQIQGVRR